VIVGLPLVARPLPTTYVGWLGWLGVAIAAGALAHRPRRAWVAWVALVLIGAVAGPLGWAGDLRNFWWLSAGAGVLVVTAGFLFGTTIGGPDTTGQQLRRAWAAIGRSGRRASKVTVALVLLAFIGYGAFAFVYGGDQYTAQVPNEGPCDNPGQRFGWAFEPVNYDASNEPTAADPSAAARNCTEYGPPAGQDVVSSDGIPIAGWYIPAASGGGPTGPTVVIVHGGQSNKTGVLKYAPPFHDRYNLLILDLRNAGQSGGTMSSAGLREQLDVRAMIDWLERTKHPRWIAVMGNSNGASTALAEARGDPRVRALILDSMHAAVERQMGNVLETEKGYFAWPSAILMLAGAGLRLGGDISTVDPVRTITEVGDRPVLLTHGSVDDVDRPAESVDLTLRAAIDAGVDVEFHLCLGAGHGKVVEACTADWTRWVNAFLAAHGSGV
jgi:pimeloyl-ACP methyl ester carboxylesterase